MVTALRRRDSPTMALLEEWERAVGQEATIEALLEMVEEVGNMPAAENLQKAKRQPSSFPYRCVPLSVALFSSEVISSIFVVLKWDFIFPL